MSLYAQEVCICDVTNNAGMSAKVPNTSRANLFLLFTGKEQTKWCLRAVELKFEAKSTSFANFLKEKNRRKKEEKNLFSGQLAS